MAVNRRTDLQCVIERIDATMRDAANDARDSAQLWKAWNFALESVPTPEQVPSDLNYWWQNQLLDASRRAFEHRCLRTRYHRGTFETSGSPIDGVIWNSAPFVYQGQEIRVELRRVTMGMPWSARVTISRQSELKVTARLFFEEIPSTVAGVVGAYAFAIEEAKREIERQDVHCP